MNVAQIRSRVQTRLGDTSGAEVTAAAILEWINDGAGEIARRTQQPQATASAPIVVGQAAYSISQFANDVMRLRKVELDGTVLEGLSSEDADTLLPNRNRAGQATGTPQWFEVWADTLTLWPPPASAGTLTLYYVKRPAQVAADLDVPGIPPHMHPDLLEYVVAQALESTGESAAADRKMSRFEQLSRESAEDASWPVRNTYPHVAVSADDVGY